MLEEWITYFYIDKILEIAQKKYETGKQPKVMEQANLFLNSMTRGKYSILLEVSLYLHFSRINRRIKAHS